MLDATPIKFFDVECARGSTYDLKQLRHLFEEVIGPRVAQLKVFYMDHRVRVKAVLYSRTAIDWVALQHDEFDDRIVFLDDIHKDGSSHSLTETPVSPSTLPGFLTTPEVKKAHRKLRAPRILHFTMGRPRTRSRL